jgi:anti-anti-sigma factor
MATPLTLSTDRRDDGMLVLTAVGEIDMSNVDVFTQALADGAADGELAVDLCAVDYLDSGAINALFTHAERISVVANPVLIPVLTVSGLTKLVPVDPPEADC